MGMSMMDAAIIITLLQNAVTIMEITNIMIININITSIRDARILRRNNKITNTLRIINAATNMKIMIMSMNISMNINTHISTNISINISTNTNMSMTIILALAITHPHQSPSTFTPDVILCVYLECKHVQLV